MIRSASGGLRSLAPWLGCWSVAAAVSACGEDRVQLLPHHGPPPPNTGGAAIDAGHSDPPADAGAASRDASAPPPNDDPGVAATDVLGQRVLTLLGQRCGGSCHSDTVDQGGVGALTNIPRLVELGLILPGASEASPLFSRSQQEHGLPGYSWPLLTPGETALLRRFIDELAIEVPECEALPFMGFGEAMALMIEDVSALAAQDRRFARYVTLTHASNAGACGDALQRERRALFAAINGASTGPEVIAPRPIDARAHPSHRRS